MQPPQVGYRLGNWDLLLPTTKFAYHNSVSTSMGKSPFEIVHDFSLSNPLIFYLCHLNFALLSLLSPLPSTVTAYMLILGVRLHCHENYELAGDVHGKNQEFNEDHYFGSCSSSALPKNFLQEIASPSHWTPTVLFVELDLVDIFFICLVILYELVVLF